MTIVCFVVRWGIGQSNLETFKVKNERRLPRIPGGFFIWGPISWGVGQLADRSTVNREVAGSNPAAPVGWFFGWCFTLSRLNHIYASARSNLLW